MEVLEVQVSESQNLLKSCSKFSQGFRTYLLLKLVHIVPERVDVGFKVKRWPNIDFLSTG